MKAQADNRCRPARPDLAAEYLRGVVTAARFAHPQRMRVAAETTAIRAQPDAGSMQVSELLFGEMADVYETRDGWRWCQSVLDGYVGYVAAGEMAAQAAAGEAAAGASHMVSARLSHIFPEPDIKRPPCGRLTLGARIAIRDGDDRFVALAGGGYLIAGHVRPIGVPERDPASVALRLLHAPYLWGGRSSLGLDCSGLMQVAHQACGLLPPRDSDMQAAELGKATPCPKSPEELRRNDMVFFPGHCMIADGQGGLIHANATHMMVSHEAAAAVFARTGGGWQSVTMVRNAADGLT